MKVILTEHVRGIGRRHDVKDVPDGYANNFLLPKKLAILASATNLAKLDSMKKGIEIEKTIHESLLIKNLEELNDKVVTIVRKANDEGHLFSSVKVSDVVTELEKQYKINLDVKLLEDIHYKTVGEHELSVAFGKHKAKFILKIEKE